MNSKEYQTIDLFFIILINDLNLSWLNILVKMFLLAYDIT